MSTDNEIRCVPAEDYHEARRLLALVTNYLTSMPDAGLTLDDPRTSWYVESKPLRDAANEFLNKN